MTAAVAVRDPLAIGSATAIRTTAAVASPTNSQFGLVMWRRDREEAEIVTSLSSKRCMPWSTSERA